MLSVYSTISNVLQIYVVVEICSICGMLQYKIVKLHQVVFSYRYLFCEFTDLKKRTIGRQKRQKTWKTTWRISTDMVERIKCTSAKKYLSSWCDIFHWIWFNPLTEGPIVYLEGRIYIFQNFWDSLYRQWWKPLFYVHSL